MTVSVHDEGRGAVDSSHELAGADELISDLAALVEAGLVAVHEHVLGPPRYGVAPVLDHPGMASPELDHPRMASPELDHHNGRRHHAPVS